MSTAVAKRDPITEVCTVIAGDLKPKIQQALIHPEITDRFVRVVLTAVQQNPSLFEGRVDRGSFYNEVVRLAQMELLPDGREAALTRFFDKKTNTNKIQAMPMIAGLRKVAAEHGFAIEAFVVHARDDFSYDLGFNPTVTHRPPPLDQERGEPIGAYAIATGPDGRKHLEPPMSREEIEKIRAKSKNPDGTAWRDHWGEMARKTVARRLWKSLPFASTERASAVIEADDATYDLNPSPAANLPTDILLDEEVVGEVVEDDEQGTLT